MKNKWQDVLLPYATLKNKPQKLYEYFYRGIENIHVAPLPTHGSYEYFTFGDSGNLLEYTFHLSADKTMTWRYRYSREGYQVIYNDQSTQGFEEKLFTNMEKTSDGDFMETEWLFTGGKKKAFIHYSDSGNKIVRKELMEGTGTDNMTTIFADYAGERLLRKTITTAVDNSRMTVKQDYFYSAKESLDSIVQTSGQVITKTIFINNEHGDPLQEIKLVNNDTIEFYSRQYTYDKKDNWIRLLEKENKGPKTPKGSSPFVFISREIFY